MTEVTHFYIADIKGTGSRSREGGLARYLLLSPALPLMRVAEAGDKKRVVRGLGLIEGGEREGEMAIILRRNHGGFIGSASEI